MVEETEAQKGKGTFRGLTAGEWRWGWPLTQAGPPTKITQTM